MKKIPIQNDKPNTVFIFGAGASYPDGIPLQKDIIPAILKDDDPQLKRSQISNKIRIFLKDNFPYKDNYPSLEEVFGFIEYFIFNDMSLSKKWTNNNLFQLKGDLTKVLHYVISKKQDSIVKTLFNFGKKSGMLIGRLESFQLIMIH